MPYTLSTIDKLFVVRWKETLASDLDEIGRELQRWADRHGKVIYVSISDDDTPAPSDEAKRALVSFVEKHLPLLHHMYIVIDADGFRGSMLRGALAGMMLISKQRKVVTVERSMADVLMRCSADLTLPSAQVRATLVRDGMILQTPARS